MRNALKTIVLCMLVAHGAAAQEQLSNTDDLDVPEIPSRVPETGEPLLRVFVEPKISTLYETNPLRAVDGAEQDDISVAITPRARFVLTGDEVQGELALGVEVGRSLDLTQNNYIDAEARARGRWLINDSLTGDIDFRVRRDHNAINESSGDLSSAADEVTVFHDVTLDLGLEQDFDTWRLRGFGEAYFIDFDDFTPQASGLPPLFNGDRDRIEVGGGLRAIYPLSDSLSVFAEGSLDRRSYFDDLEGRSFDRSSTGYGGLTGLTYVDSTATLEVETGLGLEYRNYDASFFGSDVAPVAAVEFDYRPSEILSRIRGRFDAGIRETDLSTASGFVQYRLRFDLMKEFSPGYELSAGTDLELREFEIVQPGVQSRSDFLSRINLGMQIPVIESFFASGTVGYERRDSDVQSAQYAGIYVLFAVESRFE
ncbi:MAG: outer membrane beta-barrel protein [Pseudomonadota bacterium]